MVTMKNIIAAGACMVVIMILITTRQKQSVSRHSQPHRYTSSNQTKFPLIIHQTWSSDDVPEEFRTWIQSWLKYNPDWEYWFWSREQIDALLHTKYPHLQGMSASLTQGVKRSDIMRYVILYEFGGIYADLDMECLQDLSELVSSFRCFLSEENYEHVNLIYNSKAPIIINCVMGCRAKHPFYKDVMDNIGDRPTKINDIVTSTGPKYFTTVFQSFQRKPNISLSDHISVLPPRYLLPMMDKWAINKEKTCKDISKTSDLEGFVGNNNIYNPSLDNEQKLRNEEICQQLLKMDFPVRIYPESLMTHHWVHTWFNKQTWDDKPKVHISKLVPDLIQYTKVLSGEHSSQYYP